MKRFLPAEATAQTGLLAVPMTFINHVSFVILGILKFNALSTAEREKISLFVRKDFLTMIGASQLLCLSQFAQILASLPTDSK